MTIDRSTLLQPLKAKTEQVDLPEFGEGQFVIVQGMNAKQKNDHDASLMNSKFTGVDRRKAATQKQRMVVLCCVDESGNRILTDQDIDAVGNWPADVLNRVFDVANRLSGGITDSVASEKAAKNSEGTADD